MWRAAGSYVTNYDKQELQQQLICNYPSSAADTAAHSSAISWPTLQLQSASAAARDYYWESDMAQVVGDGDWLHWHFELCNIIFYNTNVA